MLKGCLKNGTRMNTKKYMGRKRSGLVAGPVIELVTIVANDFPLSMVDHHPIHRLLEDDSPLVVAMRGHTVPATVSDQISFTKNTVSWTHPSLRNQHLQTHTCRKQLRVEEGGKVQCRSQNERALETRSLNPGR